MYQLQALLGHRSIGMTIDLYGQLKAANVEGVQLYAASSNSNAQGRPAATYFLPYHLGTEYVINC